MTSDGLLGLDVCTRNITRRIDQNETKLINLVSFSTTKLIIDE